MINFTTIMAVAALSIASLGFQASNTAPASLAKKAVMDDSLTITSSAFKANAMIPNKYTCKGSNFNPPLHIAGMPEGVKSVAIIVEDPDAPVDGGFTHWLAWNFDQTMIDIPENYKGGSQGMNDAKKKGYYGPCPPQGTHHYHFRVFALDNRLTVAANVSKDKLRKAMEGHVLAAGDLVGLFKK